MLVVLSFISQTLVVVDTDSYSSVVVEDSSILEELSEQDGARGGNGIELVWDSPGSGMPDSIISMGDYLLYGDRDLEGCDGGSLGCGWELFRSDGTAEGSGPLKDINPGKNSSSPGGLTEVNGIAYFKADDGTNGKELWRSDGTEDGTFMVKDINPDGDSYPLYLTALGDELLFKADDGTHGYELWKSDGTADGTVLVKDLNIGEGGTTILGQYYKHAELLGEGQGFVTFEGSIYFMANNGTWSDDNRTGSELWRSDGTSEGTYLVKDIGPGNYGGLQGHLHILGNHIYFPANDNSGNGTELWRSDGTAEGTVMVKDIHPGGSGMFSPGRMILVDNNLFFFGNDGTSGQYDYELWKTDGTEGGTVKVSSNAVTSGGHYPVTVGDIFYFMGENETYGEELWRSDGTDDGTFMVKDLRSGSDDGCCGTYPYLVPTGDILYFGGYNETEGDWRMHQTDGTSDGTFPVAGADGIGHPQDFTYMGNSLFFRAPCLVWPCGGTNLHKIGNITPLNTDTTPSYSVYENEVLEPITFDYAEAYREEMVYKGSGNLSKITDIGGATSSYPDDIVVIDDIAYFTALSSEYGEELWRTDGTESGLALVKDIRPGTTGSEINNGLTRFKDSILFSANEGTHGEELWISDGTDNGTFMLKDMIEGDESSDSDPLGFLDAGDFAYFSGSNASGRELWKTDGTTNGTVLVKDIVSDGSSYPSQLTLFGDTVFFRVGADTSSELWKTDGTEEGTIQVSSSVSNIAELNVMGDALYFRGKSSGNDRELWKTDGTTAGTVRVKDINPGNAGSVPQALTVAGGTLFFNADDGINGGELWKSDGTEDGTVLVKDIRSGGSNSGIIEMVSIGNIVYFRADDGNIGRELWRSDGTEEGTYLLKDIWTGWESSDPQSFTPIGDRLFFRAEDGESGHELWISDGTESGTVMIENMTNNENDSDPKDFTKVGNHIVFSAAAGWNDRELWSFDPTEILYHSIEGMHWSITPSLPDGLSLDSSTGKITGIPTEVIDWTDYTVTLTASNPETGSYFYNGNGSSWMVKDIWSGTGSSVGCCTPFGIAYDNNFYFAAEDGTHGVELWKSDGTAAGTMMVKDIDTGSDDSDPELFTVMDNILYFIATTYSSNDELWRSDGTEEGTFMVKDIRTGSQGSGLGPLTIMGNNLYFRANDGVHGRELWKSDGTEAGTVIVKDIWSGSPSSDAGASGITAIGDTIFFRARDGTGNGQELWKSDGTANGTVMVKDIRSGGDGSFPRYFKAVGNTLYFRADDGSHGQELWKSDGTANGTVMVKDIRSGASSGNPGESTDSFTAIGNTIFFDADDGIHGYELWKSDGTEVGTVMVKDIKSGGSSDHSYPGMFTAVGNKLFFRAVPTDEHELWVSDGTENGTIMLTTPAPYSSCCGGLEAIGDTLFFRYDDGTSNESEMWRSDGTAAGTVMAQDICSPYCGGGSVGFTAVGNTIFFLAHDNTGHGIEVWAYDPTNITFGELLTFTFDFKLQVLEQLYPLFPSVDSADLFTDELMDDITFQYNASGTGTDLANVTGATCSVSPDLPDGLNIAQGTCTISGTPLEETPDTTYSVTAVIGDNTYRTVISLSSNYRDTDDDGYPDYLDDFPDDPTEWLDTDGDGIGNNADTDDDGDGLTDVQEQNSNPVTDSLDPDTDDDGYCDGPVSVTIDDVLICEAGPDAFPTDPDEWNDNDGDGIGDNEDPDDDNDNFLDVDEITNGTDTFDGCDPDENSSACDIDNDGLPKGEENEIGTNVTNPDTDGDGYCDGPLTVFGVCVGGDDFPLDSGAHKDTDGDGMPDNLTGPSTSDPALVEDPDDDNDGLTDIEEDANGNGTLDAGETNSLDPDTDDDGYCDGPVSVTIRDVLICEAGPDAFPLDPSEWLDTDGDGTGNNEDPDDDGDGLNDTLEDANGNGTVDAGETDPLKADTDGDGICDGPIAVEGICDILDRDGDGVNNEFDDFPDDPSASKDTDGDGMPDTITGNSTSDPALVEDLDDDNDGLTDIEEDTNGNGTFDEGETNSLDPDTDDDGYCDGNVTIVDVCVAVDAFPLDSSEWVDTDGDGIGNEADTDDDGDGLNDTEEEKRGSSPLLKDTDDDGIPDNWDPNPVDSDGDYDGDGILDRDEYNPNSTTGNPADSDGDGVNDMLQGVASTGSTSSSDTNWTEMCCWALLLLLLLLIPLLKRQYDNALIYDPANVDYTINDNDSKIRMVPSLHEYAKNYRSYMKYEDLRRVTYGISGNLVEGLEIDSKTGVISGHPKKVGEYKYDVVMQHSDGKFKGEITINVSEKKEESEKEEEPVAVTTSNPEPENTSSKPKFGGGAGTKMDPFVITPAKGLEPGEEIASKQVITISGLKSGGIVNMQDLDSKDNGKRFAVVSDPDEVGRQSALVADDDGKIKFRVNFKDDKPSTDGAEYEGLIKLGTASVYLSWAVEVTKEESEEVPLTKEEKKQKELERVKARSEKIDFEVLGQATSSTLSKPVEQDANEIELEDASEFEKKGTATITDADGSEIITWKSKDGNQLVGIGGLTRAFVAASIVVAKDDLQIIKGIGPFIEEKLNALGIYMFIQIARMTPELEEEVNVAIEFFPGRVKRDQWVKQAKELTE